MITEPERVRGAVINLITIAIFVQEHRIRVITLRFSQKVGILN